MIEASITFANNKNKNIEVDTSTSEYQHLYTAVVERVHMHGHAVIDGNGASIPCAAVSALGKAFVLAIDVYCTKKQFTVDAPAAGTLIVCIDVNKIDDIQVIRNLAGISMMLLRGLQGVAQEYPNEVQLHIIDNHSNNT